MECSESHITFIFRVLEAPPPPCAVLGPWIRVFVRFQGLGLFEQSGLVLRKILSGLTFFDVFNDLRQYYIIVYLYC